MVHRLAVVLCLSLCGVAHATAAAAQKVEPPKKIKNVEPQYPDSAQRARAHGDVVIEARIGTDGKVTGARVVTSIPLLDDAALAAVRQWEYSPALADGVPVSVVMTVTVHFSLQESAPARPVSTGPLILDRDGTDWTVGGTPLLDDDLRFWLRYVIRTEQSKELYFHASPASTVGEVVDVVSSAFAAGVERLFLFVGESEPAQGVRVWLEPVQQKVTTINLPVSDVASQVQSTAVPISIGRTGATASAGALVQRAPVRAVVRLRVDRSRKMSDVWSVLKPGPTRQIEGFAFGVQLPSGAVAAVNAPISAEQQKEWQKVSAQLSDLILSDKKTLDQSIAESLPILEKFVTRNPNVTEAQFKLASAYEARALRADATAQDKRRDWQNAVRHFSLAGQFDPNEDAGFLATWKIAQLYEPDALNDKNKAERYARRLVDEYPGRAMAHMNYARMLHDAGDLGGAVNVMRHGRTVSTMPLVGLAQSIQYVTEYLQGRRDLPRSAVRDCVQELLALSDAVLAAPDKSDDDSRIAIMGRVMALDAQAERLAETSAERVSLLVESDRWFESIRGGAVRPLAPAPRLSSNEAAELECRALGRWSNVVADAQPIAVAIPAVQQYVRAQPACLPPHQSLIELLTRRARETSDPRARAADLETVIGELQQVIDAGPQPFERVDAFTQLAHLAGPKELNRPERLDAGARTLLKRSPDDPAAHYAIAAALFESGRPGDGEKALRDARKAIKGTPSKRGEMAGELLRSVRRESDLPADAARRLFDEAGALLSEAEKVKGGKDLPQVISARIAWLNLSADRFEQDASRAAAQRDEAKQLQARLQTMK